MEVLYCICFFILGSILGSFYNVLGTRIPNKQSIIRPRSHCEKCGHILSWYELIPIFSYLIQGGKCNNCKTKLSWMYFFSEFFCGLLFTISYYTYGFTPNLLISLIISSVMIIVTVSDLTYMIIPDRFIVIPSILILLIKLISDGFNEMLISLGSGILAFLIMFLIMKFGSYIFKKESLGGADVKLLFLVGICLEPFLSLIVIIIASFVALPVSLLLLFKNKENVIPFGPFIIIGLLVILFTKMSSQEIVNFLLNR